MSWFKWAEAPPQLDDLAEVLAEGPEPLPGNAPASPEGRSLAAGAPAQQALAGGAAAPAAAAAADDCESAPLPVSSGSPLPTLPSPEKPAEQQDTVVSSSAAGGSWLPSVAAWLPSRVGGEQHQQIAQQQEQQPAVQQQEGQQQQQAAGQSSWRDYLPSAPLLPLPSLLGGNGGSSAGAPAAPQAASAPAAPAAAPAEAPAGGSSHDGSGLLDWAAAAPHQLASACHQAAHQLGTVGSTAVGASLLGATVGGICAGPLGAGAKSGAAWVAAGALGGAAVRRMKDGSHPAEAAAAQERELQAIKRSDASADGAADSNRASAGLHADAGNELTTD